MDKVNDGIVKKMITESKDVPSSCPSVDKRFPPKQVAMYQTYTGDNEKQESRLNVPAFNVWVDRGPTTRFNSLRDDIYE